MRILAIECSAVAASCAILTDGNLTAEFYCNVKLTHSQTLMPMVKNMLGSCMLSIDDIDFFAVSNGPGSFTGVRIGISAVKGLALPKSTPCVAVSSLEAMAYGFTDCEGIICPLMDARCDQFYNALFRVCDGRIERLCEDRALSFADIYSDLNKYNGAKILLVGDGAGIFAKKVSSLDGAYNITLAPENCRYQRASYTALCALDKLKNDQTVSAADLLPFYLRPPQAERQLSQNKQTD